MVKGRLKRESNPVPGQGVGFTPQHDSTGNEEYVNTSPVNPLPTKDADTKTELESINDKLSDVVHVHVDNQVDSIEVINLPSTQNVKDTDVKAELELIKAQQASLIASNQQILDRLDDPIDTQVTGSNDEYALPVKEQSKVEEIVVFEDLAITDTEFHTSSVFNIEKYKNIAVMALSDHNVPVSVRISSHDIAPSIRVNRMWNDSEGNFEEPKIEVPSDASRGRWTAMHTHSSWFRYFQSPVKEIRFSVAAEEKPKRGSIRLVIWGLL